MERRARARVVTMRWGILLVLSACTFDPNANGFGSSAGLGDEGTTTAGSGPALTTKSTSAGETSSGGAEAEGGASSSGVAETGEESSSGGPSCDVDPQGGGDCPARCVNGCDQGVCEIDCVGTNSCAGFDTLIECPAGWPCRVSCIGQQSCRYAHVACPPEHACEVECDGPQACQATFVACGGGTCSLACSGHDQACDILDFHCGSATSEVRCDFSQNHSLALQPASGSACGCTMEPSC